ncbi:MAG: hypothetical protein R6V05_02585 [Candidatus Brocadiia bacterium]
MADYEHTDARCGPREMLAVLLLSGAVIALELSLMRCFAVARWHHFAYLVISTALLGFGASGTLLTLVGRRLLRRFRDWSTGLTLLFALSVPIAVWLAEMLPLDVRYVLYSSRQAGLMVAHDLLMFVPFFLAATVIGLALMRFKGNVHLVYGANLLGSGLGAALAVGLMFALPPERLLYATAALGIASALLWAGRGLRLTAAGAVAMALTAHAAFMPVELRIDQYKDLATLKRWERQGSARRLLTRTSPRARLDVYASPLLHTVMFAGLTAAAPPPPQYALLADGHQVATVLRIQAAEQAEILDHTPMSVPYRMLDEPRVLLLGEAGGANVWLARRMGARHVTVVQPNPQVVQLLRGPLARQSGDVLHGPDVGVVCEGLRAYLEGTEERYDLIQIVTAESPAAGASGLRSLHEGFLLTVEGLALCLRRLSPTGVVAVTRGVQDPPRDNVKLLATLRAALERNGTAAPGRQLAQVRNLLAATTVAFARPPGPERCAALRDAAAALAMDIEWAPCPEVTYAEQVNEVDGPPGQLYSYFHHAALQLLSEDRDRFFREWAFDVRPATDDSPYFYNFFRWSSLPRFWRAYGRQWLTRLELGYVVLVVALAQAIVVGAALILLPLLWLRRAAPGGRAPTLGYFTLLGLGFMMLEMVCLLKFTRFLGDPVYSAAVVLSSFLVFSGLGSALSRLVGARPARAIRAATLGIAALAFFYAFGLDRAFAWLSGAPLPWRVGAAVLLAAPAAFLMGWPFPGGLRALGGARPGLVPWAWAVNGFASVAASPLAVLVAVHRGFTAAFAVAAGCYLVAGWLVGRLPGAGRGRQGSPHS